MIRQLTEVEIFNINDTEFDEENDGIVIVKTFGKNKIGIGVSIRKGADAELWLSPNEVENLIMALNKAIKEVNGESCFLDE